MDVIKKPRYVKGVVKFYTKRVGVCSNRVHTDHTDSYPTQPYI